jgi:hypothetical protein
MKSSRVAALLAGAGAIALIAAPTASADPAPAPKPLPTNVASDAQKVPGTSCNVGQVRAAINHISPGMVQRLQDAAGSRQDLADVVSADPGGRQLKLVGLVFKGSLTGLSAVAQEGDVESTLTEAYRTCSSYRA